MGYSCGFSVQSHFSKITENIIINSSGVFQKETGHISSQYIQNSSYSSKQVLSKVHVISWIV